MTTTKTHVWADEGVQAPGTLTAPRLFIFWPMGLPYWQSCLRSLTC